MLLTVQEWSALSLLFFFRRLFQLFRRSWAAHFFENPDKDTKLTEQKPIQENDKRDCRNTTDNQVKNQTDKITEKIYYRREEPARTVAKIRPFELTLVVRAERKRCVDVYR